MGLVKASSPCTQICKIDAFTGTCIGCKRTSQEITEWSSYSEEQRINIMEKLELWQKK
ncbi:MAG TPA: DUF1289 domain-containing protein [Saprospirales bacterium]|nr:DUF1289 domain-containing protein [Saprospirales bacterium]